MSQYSSPAPSAISGSSQAATKERQLSHLNSQLMQLRTNMEDLNAYVEATAQHYKAVERLGVMHLSLFVASCSVFGKERFGGDK